MLKQVLIGLMILVLAVFAYVGYSSYDARRSSGSGDVFSGDGRDGRDGRESRSRADMRAVPSETDPGTLPAMGGQGSGGEQVMPQGMAAGGGAPATDTISPNPPNGMVFSGTGHFQLYRQGNLTWRLDTDTGQSCVLFATDEEWRKPKVYHAGCAGK